MALHTSTTIAGFRPGHDRHVPWNASVFGCSGRIFYTTTTVSFDSLAARVLRDRFLGPRNGCSRPYQHAQLLELVVPCLSFGYFADDRGKDDAAFVDFVQRGAPHSSKFARRELLEVTELAVVEILWSQERTA